MQGICNNQDPQALHVLPACCDRHCTMPTLSLGSRYSPSARAAASRERAMRSAAAT